MRNKIRFIFESEYFDFDIYEDTIIPVVGDFVWLPDESDALQVYERQIRYDGLNEILVTVFVGPRK